MEELPLFGASWHTLRRNVDPQTSHEAAKKVDTTGLEKRVYDTIKLSGQRGMISDEVRESLSDIKSYSSVTARYKSLKEKGLVELTGERRKGWSGRGQGVMVAK